MTGVLILGVSMSLFGEFYVIPSTMEYLEKRDIERQSPEYLAKQAAFILCERSIKETLEYPYSYSHSKLFNTRIGNKTGSGDEWTIRLNYSYINKNNHDVSESTTCAIKDGVSKIVMRRFR